MAQIRGQMGLQKSPYDREIARLAIPALGALIAEPLYTLADTAVVGHLGTPHLGGLAVASQVLLGALSLFIFLAYGTTAAVGRLIGAGDHYRAAQQAVQGLWLAAAVGTALAAAAFIFADPLLRILGADGEVLAQGRIYLRISIFGLPGMLITLAGVGYLRGLQDTLRPLKVAVFTAGLNLALELVLIYGLGFGIGASALSTVVAQWLAAGAYVWWIRDAVTAHGVTMAPDRSMIARLAVVGLDLFLRTAALRASFTMSVAVAARLGDIELAAHEVIYQLMFFLALVLDAVAIAGQAMIGRYLGANELPQARAAGRRMIEWGLATGLAATIVILVTRPWLPLVFSSDEAVLSLVGFLMLHLAFIQPVNGVVFALDGVLIGAGDMRFLAVAMAGAAAVFIPLALWVMAADAGIGWLWGAMWALMGARIVALLWRFSSSRWLVPGAVR
ncbi:MAG: MATE family efflux transporter [Acidimicrobiia bacterium]|nr:MATE family efflux transporter [Acidimicrobiia bacterium]MYG59522.1 MATE family efflux transporter [Acidimicrobiia bacterium]MYJ31606.1 MATE family efflux transporter [Acidimicrobiia bacterium]